MTALHGTLQDLSVIDLTQVLVISRKTGTLAIENGGITGRLHFVAGELTHAEIVLTLAGAVLLQAEAAFYNVLRWCEARFTFEPAAKDAPAGDRTIHADMRQLLFEGLRRIDEEDAPAPALGLHSYVELDPAVIVAAGANINEIGQQILRLVRWDITRVSDLAHVSGLGQLLTLMTVVELADAGLLRVRGSVAGPAATDAPPVLVPDSVSV